MVWVNDKPINPAATYTITANEFLVNSLPLFGVQISDVNLFEDVTEFQVVLDYIISKGGYLLSVEEHS